MENHPDGPRKEDNTPQPQRKTISDMAEEYKKMKESEEQSFSENSAKNVSMPTSETYSPEHFQEAMSKETDPDLIISYEIIKLPSKGLFYSNKMDELKVEYMTAKDEDLITTPSLIESGKVLDVLLKRKIKTKGVNPEDLLPGDRNAILLFLRTSSYGFNYDVEVIDPRKGIPFKTTVDLSKLEYKEMPVKPDDNGYFEVMLPMRKKKVKFRLISSGEDNLIFRKAEEIKEAYEHEFSEYNTLKLKTSIVSIDGKTDKSYINRFVDAMPAGDSLAIKKKMNQVAPDVDMMYEFTAKDGFKFKTLLSVGVDFFFPQT